MGNSIELLKKGLGYIHKKDYDIALNCFISALAEDNTEELNSIIHQQIGVCYLYMKEYESAEKSILESLNIVENNDTYESLFIIYEKQKDTEKAAALINTLISKYPEDVNIQYRAIDFYISTKDYENALEALSRLEGYAYDKDKVNCYLYEIHKGLLDLDTAYRHINEYLQTSENALDRDVYMPLCSDAFAFSIYDEIYTDDEYIKMMRDIYDYVKPTALNSFDMNVSLFRSINVGFMSYDFKLHPVGFFMLALFKNKLDISGLNFFCYYTDPEKHDEVTKKIQTQAHEFKNIGNMDNDEITRTVIEDRLDILFDLNGSSIGHKLPLFVNRMAPIQISWIGYPATTAMPNMDYVIMDEITDPIGVAEKFYTEGLIRMSKTFLCCPFETELAIDHLPFDKNGYISFGSFNNGLKYSNKTLAMWVKIMNELPTSKLLLRSQKFESDFIKECLIRRLKEHGFDMRRIELENATDFSDYLEQYNRIDIILDTYPFNGATTTCDAFNMGVPLVSLYGGRHVSRVGLSMLTNVGLADLATATPYEYVKTVLELAGDISRLRYLRQNLRQMMQASPLSDTLAFRIELEEKLREVFIEKCAEGSNTSNHKEKAFSDLFVEIILGIRFIGNMQSKLSRECKDLTLKELSSLQNEFCLRLREEYTEDANALEFVAYYQSTVDLLDVDLSCVEINSLLTFYLKCLEKLA